MEISDNLQLDGFKNRPYRAYRGPFLLQELGKGNSTKFSPKLLRTFHSGFRCRLFIRTLFETSS